jgi:hypothetical protein
MLTRINARILTGGRALRRILFVGLALILPLAAAAEPFGKPLQKTCAQLQSDGWTAPIDPQTGRRERRR